MADSMLGRPPPQRRLTAAMPGAAQHLHLPPSSQLPVPLQPRRQLLRLGPRGAVFITPHAVHPGGISSCAGFAGGLGGLGGGVGSSARRLAVVAAAVRRAGSRSSSSSSSGGRRAGGGADEADVADGGDINGGGGGSGVAVVERVEDVDLSDEVYKSYGTYAMSVIVSRAIPDVRDGLKPVHRRILYAMYELGLTNNKSFKKCARVVGEVLGKFHPHGDSAVYDALVRMAQGFSMREPLVDGHGNFGSLDDDPPAAMRYTECRLTPLASDMMLSDLAHRETVGWRPTFDESQMEPEVLPAVAPNLLINGTHGIAVGLASSIPPHNLGEVVAALRALIADPEVTTAQLMQHVRGPDFPTGGELLVGPELVQAYETGSGSVVLRGKATIERSRGSGSFSRRRSSVVADTDDEYGSGWKEQIVITELPYQEYKAKLVTRIAELIDGRKLEGVSDVQDESDRTGVRVVVDVKRGFNAEVLLGQLYKVAGLERKVQFNMMCLSGSKPQKMGLKQILQNWLDFRCEVVTRRSESSLRAAQQRLHLVEGFLRLLREQGLRDAVLADVTGAADGPAARRALVDKRGFSSEQAEAILDRKVRGLTALEASKLDQERSELQTSISFLTHILTSRPALLSVVEGEAAAVAAAYPDPRRTQLVAAVDVAPAPDPALLQPSKPCLLLATKRGFLRRLGAEAVASQNRNTRGKSGIKLRSGDTLAGLATSLDRDQLLLFSPAGKMFQTAVQEVPSPQASGAAAAASAPSGASTANILKLAQSFPIAALLPIPRNLAPASSRTSPSPSSPSSPASVSEDGEEEDVDEAAAAAADLDPQSDSEASPQSPAGPSIVLCSRRGLVKRIRIPTGKVSRAGLTVATFDRSAAASAAAAADGDGDGESDAAAASADDSPQPKRRGRRRAADGAAGADELGWAALAASEEDVLAVVTAAGQGLMMRAADVRLMGRTASGVKAMRLGSARRPNDAVADVAVVPAELAVHLGGRSAAVEDEAAADEHEEDEETEVEVAPEGSDTTTTATEEVAAGPCLFIVTAHGLGKRIPLSLLQLGHRAMSGQKIIKLATAARPRRSKGEKTAAKAAAAAAAAPTDGGNGGGGGAALATVQSVRGADRVVGAVLVRDGEEVVLASRNGVVVRQLVDGIAVQGRTTRGTFVMQLDDGDEVADVAVAPRVTAAAAAAAAASAVPGDEEDDEGSVGRRKGRAAAAGAKPQAAGRKKAAGLAVAKRGMRDGATAAAAAASADG